MISLSHKERQEQEQFIQIRNMDTIKDYFELLPEPYKSLAIENTSEDSINKKSPSLKSAICNAFMWSATEQGHNYWKDLLIEIECKNFL